MASRRDELQAFQFLRQRVVGALVVHETDPERPPFRRTVTGLYGTLAIAFLALAVVGVYGHFVPIEGKKFTPGKDIIVEKETGTRFVFLGGRLNPVANFSSARLIAGDDAGTTSVARKALIGIPRGREVGIPGAPDELPDAQHLLRGPWTICAQSRPTASGGRIRDAVLLVGRPPADGSSMTHTAVLVDVPDTDRHYLIWHGYRHELFDNAAVSAGLGLAKESRIPVSPTFADQLPAGVSIGPVSVPGAGGPSQALPSRPQTRTGQLFFVQVSATVRQYYLAQSKRLVPISPFQFAIQLAARATRAGYPSGRPVPIALDPAEVTLAGEAPRSLSPADPPRTRPDFVRTATPRTTVCGAFDSGGKVPRVSVGARLPGRQESLPTTGTSATGTPLADRIMVPAGWAVLVTAVQDNGVPAGTVSLITDGGRRFSLVNADVVQRLGFKDARPVRMPAGLVARIPAGPALDPAVARRPS